MHLRTFSIFFILLSLSFSCSEKQENLFEEEKETQHQTEDRFLVNSLGDTIPIGLPIRIEGKPVDVDRVEIQMKTAPLRLSPKIMPAHPNLHPASSPTVIPIPEELTVITPGKAGTPLPEIVPAIGKVAPAHQPISVPALPLRYKEDAGGDLQYLDKEQGLASPFISTLYEDSRGHLWIGSHPGVSRYDGKHFTHFSKEEGLLGNSVISIMEDSRGNLWFGFGFFLAGEGGVCRYDGQQFTHYTAAEGFSNEAVIAMLEDSRGRLWFGTLGSGVICFELNGRGEGHFIHYTEKQGLSGDEIRAIAEDSGGNLWFGTSKGGLTRYDGESFTHFTEAEGVGANRINSILEDSQGQLWIGADNGLSRYDGDRFTRFTTKEGLSGNQIGTMVEDTWGHLWLGTYDGGVSGFDGDGFIHLSKEQGLPGTYIWTMLADSQGNIWFGIPEEGVIRYKSRSFIHFPKTDELVGYRTENIRGGPRGDIWMCNAYGSLLRYDGKYFTNYGYLSVSNILNDGKGNLWFGVAAQFGVADHVLRYDGEQFTQYYITESLQSQEIRPLHADSRGYLWFGTDHGLLCYDGQRFSHFTGQNGELNGINQKVLDGKQVLEDKKGDLWFGTSDGILRYNGEGFIQYTEAEGLSSRLISPMLEDNRGSLWFGTHEKSLIRYENGNFIHYSPDVQAFLLEDSRGDLWFSPGLTGGLIGFDGEGFTRYSKPDGMTSRLITSVAEDSLNRLWIGGDKGIAVFHAPSEDSDSSSSGTKKFVPLFHFDNKDGLGKIGSVSTVQIDQKNRLWWVRNAGIQGISMLDLRKFEFPAKPPVLHLDRIDVNQQTLDYRRLLNEARQNDHSLNKALNRSFDSVASFFNYPVNIALPYRLNHLTFHFSAIDWAGPQKIRYRYRMIHGFKEDWSQLQAEPKIDYRNLSPGAYTLQVEAIGAAGVWSEPFFYSFRIRPPWWLSWWVKVLYAIAALAVLYSLYAWRTREQQKQIARQEKELAKERQVNEQLKKVDQLKDQFLANTSHELRTPLQGIIGLSEFWQEKTEDDQLREDMSMITSSGKRLSSLVNDILDFSKLKNYDVQLLRRPINLSVLADIVLRNNAPLVKGKDLELINDISADLSAAHADENRLQQVLYNLIGNAIKFTEKGYIKLNAQERGNAIQISVEDTGTGIPANKREAIFQEFEQGDGSISREFAGTGLGLSISRRLVELHDGQMWVESQVGKGSTFFFTLPVSTKKASALTPVKMVGQAFPLKDISDTIASPSNAGDSIRILVVDDEPINQQVLKNHLSGQGFQLVRAMNGAEAIKAIQNQPPFDLVLLDVMMPRMSGYEVCQEIREKYLPSELPIIMVTAKNQLQNVVEGLSLGANDYLSKPFHKEELLARINTQLDLHRIFDVAGRFVPNEFLHSLNRNRITEVALGDYAEKEVTILFTDIRGYTTLSETMRPEQNFKFVNAFHGRMGPVIQKHGGFVNQYLGDGIMAIFPQKPENALEAAIEMQKVLREYNFQRQAQNRQTLKVGVGLHTGSLIMGVIGDRNRMDAATIADTVNTASRIESLTKHYGVSILVSEDSLQKMQGASNKDRRIPHNYFHLRNLGEVQVKGKKEPVGVYECYDGDAPEIAAKKLESIQDFEKGFTHFFAREFPEAAAAFNQVLKRNPEDHTARLFLNKSSRYTIEGVPEDWTGVEIMTFK